MLKTVFPPRAAMTLTTRHKLRLLYLIGLAAVAVAGGYAARHLEPTGPIPPPLPADDEPDTWATKVQRQKLIVDRIRDGEITLRRGVEEIRALNTREPVILDRVQMGASWVRPGDPDRAEKDITSYIAGNVVTRILDGEHDDFMRIRLTRELEDVRAK